MNLLALKAFIFGTGATISFTNPFTGDTKTIGEWAALGSVEQVHQALNSVEIGQSLGKTALRENIAPGDVWVALMTSDGWASVSEGVKNDLSRVIREDPFPIGQEKYYNAVRAAVTSAYPNLLSTWDSLRFRPASVAEADFPGLTEADITAALAL